MLISALVFQDFEIFFVLLCNKPSSMLRSLKKAFGGRSPKSSLFWKASCIASRLSRTIISLQKRRQKPDNLGPGQSTQMQKWKHKQMQPLSALRDLIHNTSFTTEHEHHRRICYCKSGFCSFVDVLAKGNKVKSTFVVCCDSCQKVCLVLSRVKTGDVASCFWGGDKGGLVI